MLESSHDGCLTVFIRLFLTLTIFIQIVLLYLFLPRSLPRHIFPVPHNNLCRLTCYPQFVIHSSHFFAVTYYTSGSRYLLTTSKWTVSVATG